MGKEGYVYIFRNTVNDKLYIGQTIRDLNKRIYRHKYNAFNLMSDLPLYKSIRKHGFDNFEILYYKTKVELLDHLEIFLINKFNTTDKNYGYNICFGGNSRKGFKHTEEAKRKIGQASANREIKRGHHLSENHKRNISEGNKGKIVSKETCNKIKMGLAKHYDNNLDREKHRIHKLGSLNPASKYNEDLIIKIKTDFHVKSKTKKEISENYNIPYSTCANILNGYRWAHIGINTPYAKIG